MTGGSLEEPDAAGGPIATGHATTATANDGGSPADAADAWPGDCPPPSDPYWDGVFSDASVDAGGCGITRMGACNAVVTGEYVCAAIAHGAVSYNSCPLGTCGSCGGGYCSISWATSWQSADGTPLRTTDDAGNCLIPLDATANTFCGQAGRPSAGLGATTLAQVAEEEISHAELSRRIHAWAMPLLDDESRVKIASAMTRAIAELGNELARTSRARCETASDDADGASLGIPTSSESRALHAALARGLWYAELSQIAS
jgi:hypothetical protein